MITYTALYNMHLFFFLEVQTEVPFKKIMITFIHKTYILGLLLLEIRRQIPKTTTDDHYYQSVAAMTRCKLVALKFLSTLSYVALTSEGLMRRTAHTCDLKLGTH